MRRTFLLLALVFVTKQAEARRVSVRQIPSNSSSHNTTKYNLTTENEVDHIGENCSPSNCLELKLAGVNKSGIYTLYPRVWFNEKPFNVFCDMETDGGGWTVIQRRGNFPGNQEHFNRSWTDYRDGFGNLKKEFWLGLNKIFLLTVQDQVTLRVDLEDFEGNRPHAIYLDFQIGDRDKKFAVYPTDYKGTAGDPFWVGTPFSTENDFSVSKKCVNKLSGGWWTNNHCPPGEKINNLNGVYYPTGSGEDDAIYWTTWRPRNALKETAMKLRPSFFPKCKNGGSHYYYT